MKKQGQNLILGLLCLLGSISPTVAQTCHNSLPSYVHFENGFLFWQNESSDDFDWTRRQGSTPTPNTGPSAAHAGDHYAHIEATGNYGKEARLLSPCIDFQGRNNAYISFRYHAFGTGIGSLQLEAALEGSANWLPVWTLGSAREDQWKYVKVDLSAYHGQQFRLRWVANVTELDDAGDVAIDACYLYADQQATQCNGPATSCLAESFESNSSDFWATGDWQTEFMPNVLVGPLTACDGTQFMKLATPQGYDVVNRGTVTSPCVSLNSAFTAQISFCSYYYRFQGQGASPYGYLYADISTNNGATWTQIYARDLNVMGWVNESVPLTAYANQVVRFRWRGEVGQDFTLGFDHVLSGCANKRTSSAGPSRGSSISVFPNPATTQATVEWTQEDADPVRLSLYDLSGQLVLDKSLDLASGLQRQLLDLKALPNGTYVLRLDGASLHHRQLLTLNR